MSSEQYFGRNDTKVMKGIAALLMIIHHLWAFPDRIPLENGFASTITIFGDSLFLYLGRFSKFCVSMYMFLGGYGICKSWLSGKLDIVKKLKELYIAYWKIFVVFVPIGFLFFGNQSQYCENIDIGTRFSQFSIKELLNNFLGIAHSYNGEWWFFFSYIIAVVTFPLVLRLMKDRPLAYNVAGIVIFSILMHRVFPAIGSLEVLGNLNKNLVYRLFFCQKTPFISCFWMGILFAKENVLEMMRNALKCNKMLHPVSDVLIGGVITFLVNTYSSHLLDFLYVPILIIVILDFWSYVPFIDKVFGYFGRYSTNIWLCHSFFCYYFGAIAVWIVKSGNAWLSLLLLIGISLAASIAVDYFWKILGKLKDLCLSRRVGKV